MEDSVGDVGHCEEQLRTTLHCDDKEKLRRRLALLQREYLRTAQRLQRAERLEAVRRHVRSRISQQNDQEDQTEPEAVSNLCFQPPSPSPGEETPSRAVQNRQHTGGPADSSESRRSQLMRFLLPSDAACTSTPDSCLDPARGQRPSPALRLRSRRSRLRWEKRSTEGGRSTDNSEEGQEQSERTGEEESHAVKSNETVVNESGELFSASESESPSLLLTHCNPQEQSGTGETVENQERREKNTVSNGQGCSQSEKRKESEGKADGESSTRQRDGTFCEDSNMKNTEQQTECEPSHVDIKGAKNVIEEDGKRLLDSCTLVEGLLFPAEYYVRTTRRMTVSQSQPDMQAVILSQLSVGRHRRSRGRGRQPSRQTHTNEQHTQTDFSSTQNESASVGLHTPSQAANTSLTCNSQSSSEISDQVSVSQTNVDPLCTPRPSRGRRRKGGRGRGRSQTPRPAHQQGFGQTSAEPQPASASVTSSPSAPGADPSKLRLTSEEGAPMCDNPEAVFNQNTATQHSSVGNVAQSSSAPGHVEKVYPIFLKSSRSTSSCTQNNSSAADWRSLLLPSSPAAQTSLLPLPSLTPSSLINHLVNFDMVQDFHLPDDQFASLKLHKLRQVAVASGVEHFTSPSYNTRSSSSKRYADTVTPLPLSLSPTPTVEEKQTTTQPVDLQNPSAPSYESIDKVTSRSLAEEKSESIHTERQSSSVVQDSEFADQRSVSHRCTHTSSGLQVRQLEDQTSTNQQTENKAMTKTVSLSECSAKVCTDAEVSEETPVITCVNISAKNAKEPSDHLVRNAEKCLPRYSVRSQLLLSPPLSSAPSCPLTSSPGLPSLGRTPHPVPAPTSSPSAPSLALPPPHSPSTQDLSPPDLSPLPPSLCAMSPSAQIQVLSEPPPTAELCRRVGPGTCPSLHGTDGQVDVSLDKQSENEQKSRAEEHGSCTHTLKAPAGGCLVDACSLLGSSGSVCVAAAGKWAVCVWTQTSASGWDLLNTWTFNEPVISVFPVPDAVGLMCVTLGQLEIREVRMLSCSSFAQALVCDGIIQTVVGAPKSRVVSSCHSASTSTLQVFTLSDISSTQSCQPLVSPGVSIGALAPVDGLSDALIGTDECGRLFIWNLKTGHLLQKITLGEGLSHSACLRGYSCCGVLFVLMQHHFLGSLEEVGKEAEVKYQMFPEEEEKNALFSLVAVNPRCGKSVLATRLYPPKSWSGRSCEADVRGCSVVGVSQTGCVCVWDLSRRGGPRTPWASESEGWQLARWGGHNILLSGHHNGDVTLHDCSHTPLTAQSIR